MRTFAQSYAHSRLFSQVSLKVYAHNRIFLRMQRKFVHTRGYLCTKLLIFSQVLEDFEALEKGNPAHRLYSSSMAGNKVSILAGDFLLSRASVLLASLRNTQVLHVCMNFMYVCVYSCMIVDMHAHIPEVHAHICTFMNACSQRVRKEWRTQFMHIHACRCK